LRGLMARLRPSSGSLALATFSRSAGEGIPHRFAAAAVLLRGDTS